MLKLIMQTAVSAVFGVVLLGFALFASAGTLDYWQAWVFIAVFAVATLVPSFYLAVKDPAALQRRMRGGPKAETRTVQKIVITVSLISVVAVLIISAVDHREGWSYVPVPVVILGDLLVLAGLGLAQAVVFQNSFAGASIRVEAEQRVVSTGLYGVVRHPMYVGTVLLMIGIPLALGSYWGLLAVVVTVPALAVRITDEEKMLRTELDGYAAYTEKVRYRLVPYVW
ncbi:methyltransferase family protein [Mycolicibacterium brisbanense]